MANTTWNPSDKSAGITLTGSNLIATNNNNAPSGVRSTDRQLSGKFYWEYTCNTFTLAGNGVGAMSAVANIATSISTVQVGSCGVRQTGVIYVDGASTGISLTTIASGAVVCVAVDCTSRLIWFRLGAAGNWNANAGYSPASGVGGISIPNLGNGIPIYPWVNLGNTNDQVTANFGDTAFTGAVPSGYTSGFTAYTGTTLLCHADGTNGSTAFTDVSGRAHTLTSVGSAVVSTSQVRFGTGSGNFTAGGAAQIQVTSDLNDFDFGALPFTMECWAYASSSPGVASLISQFNNSPGGGWFFGSISGVLQMWCYDSGGTQRQIASSTAIPTGAWHHYAVDRDASGMVRLYLDGVVVASMSVPTFQIAALQTNIGNSNRNTDGWSVGYIDEVRITKGMTLYGGAFTPPTAPLSPVGAPIPTNALASQVAAEHWLTTNPAAQITQVVLEHWMSVAEGVPVVPSLDTRVMVLA